MENPIKHKHSWQFTVIKSKRKLDGVIFACAIVCSILPFRTARADSLCGQWDTLRVLDGEYRINNNIWGSTPGTQCITAYPNSTYFSVTTSDHNTPNAVEAYPFILKGYHWGNCTTGSGLPILVSNVVTAPFIWSVDPNSATGKWNIAYESWFSTTLANATANAIPDGAEFMVWINYSGGMFPAGTWVERVNIGGYTWDVWYTASKSPPYIACKITTPTNYVNLDFKDFINYAVGKGWISTSWYLDNMEAGFELMVSGQGMTSKSFAALVNEKFSLNFLNFATFANQWPRTDCDGINNRCNDADFSPEDRMVDINDPKEFTELWLVEQYEDFLTQNCGFP